MLRSLSVCAGHLYRTELTAEALPDHLIALGKLHLGPSVIYPTPVDGTLAGQMQIPNQDCTGTGSHVFQSATIQESIASCQHLARVNTLLCLAEGRTRGGYHGKPNFTCI